MAEAIGIIASASQLVEYSLKVVSAIAEALHTLKYAPETLQGKLEQVLRLKEAADAIRSNCHLHTELIHGHLEATIARAESLHTIILSVTLDYTTGSFQRRLWKAILKKGEKTLLRAFDNLEREKLSLLLCIQIASAETMGNIGQSVGLLSLSKESEKVALAEKSSTKFVNMEDVFSDARKRHEKNISSSQSHTPRAPQNTNQTGNTYTNVEVTNGVTVLRGDNRGGQNHNFGDSVIDDRSVLIAGTIGANGGTPGCHFFGHTVARNHSSVIQGTFDRHVKQVKKNMD